MKTDLARYKKLKDRIQKLGLVIPGTLRVIYQRCGKSNCRCSSGKIKDKHGPYTYWDRKHNGKLTSSSIAYQHTKLIEQGITNRKKLENLTKQMLTIGERYARKLEKH